MFIRVPLILNLQRFRVIQGSYHDFCRTQRALLDLGPGHPVVSLLTSAKN